VTAAVYLLEDKWTGKKDWSKIFDMEITIIKKEESFHV
jgi:hypothetical protein